MMKTQLTLNAGTAKLLVGFQRVLVTRKKKVQSKTFCSL